MKMLRLRMVILGHILYLNKAPIPVNKLNNFSLDYNI